MRRAFRRSGVQAFRAGVGAALKAFAMAFAGWGGQPGSSGYFLDWRNRLSGVLPGSNYDYEGAAGDVTLNGAVSICLGWLADNVGEAEFGVTRAGTDGERHPVPGHPLARLVAEPNGAYDGDTLWAATVMSYSAFGNAYWLKARGDGGLGAVRELWFVPHWQVRPVWPTDGSKFLAGYEYRVNNRLYNVAVEDVVHFRFGIDPVTRLGISRLYPLLREVCTDNEASTYLAAVMRNAGVVPCVISPGGADVEIDDRKALGIKLDWSEQTAGENRGRPVVLTAPVRVDRLGLTPEELALDKIRQLPEARICAALRIPALVVGLGSSDRGRTYRNYQEARRAAYEDGLLPLQRRFARTLDAQLLPDLGRPGAERCDWDHARVPALREDRNEVFAQNTVAVAGGWMQVNEARARVSLPAVAGEDRFLRGADAPKVPGQVGSLNTGHQAN